MASVLKSASRLMRGKRFGDAAAPAAAGAVVDLGGQRLGQVGQVGLPFADGDVGEPGGVGAGASGAC
jgi:hypothetical protein